MSKSVSNDALWEKLSEIEEKISKYLKEQETSVPTQEQVDISPELKVNKDEIIDVFKKCIHGFGTHCDAHFKVIHKNTEQLGEGTDEIYKVLACIRNVLQDAKEQPETNPTQKQDKSCLDFKFFKIRKTILRITILGLLVFILTLFCMKQQNDYTLLNNKYYRQNVVIREMRIEVDSLKNTLTNQNVKKK